MKPIIAGLLGRKLGHSYSPLIHSFFGDYEYRLFEREPEQLAAFLGGGEYDALNVTVPYKKAVVPFCSRLSNTAARTGSVNTVIRENGGLSGFNTDYNGFYGSLIAEGAEIRGKTVALLGDGGAAATVRAVLNAMGAEKIITVSRRGEVKFTDYDKFRGAEVIINATPVGMFPQNGEAPIELQRFTNVGFVYDLIYNPALTALLLSAEGRGIKCANGLSMLVRQARASSELFTGEKIADNTVSAVIKRVAADMLNIVLIGMPGAGKSTVGRLLADKLGRTFADTDEIVAEIAGETPEELILSRGEEKFREIEVEAVARAGKVSGCVIAAGGGVVTRAVNYPALKQNGRIIFLDVPPERLAASGRPLSGDLDRRRELYKERLPLYRSFADEIITVPHQEPPYATMLRIQN